MEELLGKRLGPGAGGPKKAPTQADQLRMEELAQHLNQIDKKAKQ